MHGKHVKYINNFCVRRRINILLIQIGVKIVWDNIDSMNGWILGCASGIPADCFAGADDITKERGPGIRIIERTP